MPDCVNSACRLFADDTKLYRVILSQHDQNLLQNDIASFCQWSKDWLLKFYSDKCKAVQYGKHSFNSQYEMTNSDGTTTIIQTAESEKDLGVNFTVTLKFDEHVSITAKKANRITSLLKRSFVYMDKEIFSTLYKALIRPILDYGNSVYYPTTKKSKHIIENVQRRASKIVPQLKELPYSVRLQELNLPTTEYRHQRGDKILLFKMIHRIDYYDFTRMFSFSTNPHELRGNMDKLIKPQASKSVCLNSFSNRVINTWNALPNSVLCADSVNTFQSKLDKEWCNKRFDTVEIY